MKSVYIADGVDDGKVIAQFTGGVYDSWDMATFDAWVQTNYPKTPPLKTYDITFDMIPSSQLLVLDASKNPTGSVVSKPKADYFSISSDKAQDFDGRPAANGDNVDVHTLTITKIKGSDDLIDSSYSGTDRILITSSIPLSATSCVFTSGSCTISVGPLNTICDFDFSVVDTTGTITRATAALRFK